MNATRKLHDLGQRLWLDNITREMLDSGILARYIAELSVTGLTSNPTILEHVIGPSEIYDDAIQMLAAKDLPFEDIFFELALRDLKQAADLFRPIHDASTGIRTSSSRSPERLKAFRRSSSRSSTACPSMSPPGAWANGSMSSRAGVWHVWPAPIQWRS